LSAVLLLLLLLLATELKTKYWTAFKLQCIAISLFLPVDYCCIVRWLSGLTLYGRHPVCLSVCLSFSYIFLTEQRTALESPKIIIGGMRVTSYWLAMFQI